MAEAGGGANPTATGRDASRARPGCHCIIRRRRHQQGAADAINTVPEAPRARPHPGLASRGWAHHDAGVGEQHKKGPPVLRPPGNCQRKDSSMSTTEPKAGEWWWVEHRFTSRPVPARWMEGGGWHCPSGWLAAEHAVPIARIPDPPAPEPTEAEKIDARRE